MKRKSTSLAMRTVVAHPDLVAVAQQEQSNATTETAAAPRAAGLLPAATLEIGRTRLVAAVHPARAALRRSTDTSPVEQIGLVTGIGIGIGIANVNVNVSETERGTGTGTGIEAEIEIETGTANATGTETGTTVAPDHRTVETQRRGLALGTSIGTFPVAVVAGLEREVTRKRIGIGSGSVSGALVEIEGGAEVGSRGVELPWNVLETE